MVNRIKLDIDDRVISIGMLHQRTLLRWSSAVDATALKTAIRECITSFMDSGYSFAYSGNSEFLTWAPAALIEATQERSWIRVRLLPNQEWTNVGDHSLARMLNQSVGTLMWDDPDIMAFMCIATYRALIKKQQGFIPGLANNITIAGAIATVLKLGIDISLPE